MAQTSYAEFSALGPTPSAFSTPSPTGEPGLPATENKVFYPALDGLRAVAVLLVFFQHYRLQTNSWLAWGWVGVDIFFVLSGFLITGILFDTRHAPNRFSSFYARRTLRIFPLFYGVWLVTLCLSRPLHLGWSARWWLWPVYLGNYMHLLVPLSVSTGTLDWLPLGPLPRAPLLGSFLSFGHLWSLCVEEQFYLVWPFVVFHVLDRRRLLRICCIGIAALPLVRLAAILLLSSPITRTELLLRLYRDTPFRFDGFLVGAAVALALRGTRSADLLRLCRPALAVLAIAFALSLLGAVRFLHLSPNQTPDTLWISTVGYTLIDLMAACVLLLALQPTSLLFHLFQWPPFPQLGRISYGFYVLHDIFHDSFTHTGDWLSFHLTHHIHRHVGILLALLVTLLLSTLSYHLFEVPFLRLKRFFTAA